MHLFSIWKQKSKLFWANTAEQHFPAVSSKSRHDTHHWAFIQKTVSCAAGSMLDPWVKEMEEMK